MKCGWTQVAHSNHPEWPVTGIVHHSEGCRGNDRWWPEDGEDDELAKSPEKCGTCLRMKSVKQANGDNN